MPKNISLLKIHWWGDVYGRSTCHMNTPGLSFKESLIGEVFSSGSLWYNVPNEQEASAGFKTQVEAKKDLLKRLGAEPVEIWD